MAVATAAEATDLNEREADGNLHSEPTMED
jgi:hypothetical protein